jgi:hypothetical protein
MLSDHGILPTTISLSFLTTYCTKSVGSDFLAVCCNIYRRGKNWLQQVGLKSTVKYGSVPRTHTHTHTPSHNPPTRTHTNTQTCGDKRASFPSSSSCCKWLEAKKIDEWYKKGRRCTYSIKRRLVNAYSVLECCIYRGQ